MLTLSWIQELSVIGLPIVIEQENFDRVIFWLTAFGFLIAGCAFFQFSSPKQSIRRAIFALLQILINCMYIWSYKFSGATEIFFTIQDLGYVALNVSEMVMLYLGIYFITVVLKGYDLIDFIVNREKIRDKRYAKSEEVVEEL